MKIWNYEDMFLALQTMTVEEKHKLLMALLRDEAVMIMVRNE